MKINRKDPRSIISALGSLMVYYLALILLPFVSKKEDIIVFFGHKLNGNLKYIFDRAMEKQDIKTYFLFTDPEYQKKLTDCEPDLNKHSLSAKSLRDMMIFHKANKIVTSHGMQLYGPHKKIHKSVTLFDVWHGIPYKGWLPDNFKHMYNYDKVLVTSKLLKNLYINKYGFMPSQLSITGYSRTDVLVDPPDKADIKKKYSLPKKKKIVLFAPTWAQDVKDRPILPFGTSPIEFFGNLDSVMSECGALMIVRTHLNSGNIFGDAQFDNIVFMPYIEYENAEDFLNVADVLITDWSSIAFDFLVKNMPAIFVDVKPPFRYGFSLGPEYRFGHVSVSLDDLKLRLGEYLTNQQVYYKQYGAAAERIKSEVYNSTLDGKSTERSLKLILNYTNEKA